MVKEKSQKVRKAKQFSQDDMAQYLNISQGYYNLKENGKAAIYDNEWGKLAQLLDVPVEDIYEENENLAQNIENIENVSSSYIGNNNVYCNIPDYILQDLHNTINKWQEENQSLKEEIQHLKEENETLRAELAKTQTDK